MSGRFPPTRQEQQQEQLQAAARLAETVPESHLGRSRSKRLEHAQRYGLEIFYKA